MTGAAWLMLAGTWLVIIVLTTRFYVMALRNPERDRDRDRDG